MEKVQQSSYHFIILEQDQRLRLDKFIANKLAEISRSKIKKFIESNKVSINGHVVNDPSYLLKVNDAVYITLPDQESSNLKAYNIDLEVVFEDEYLIVINKPAGLTVHPGAGNQNKTLANALIYHFTKLSSIAGALRPGIVHRLDKNTSGLILIAKDDITHYRLSKSLSKREISRKYLALTFGVPHPRMGVIETNIARSQKDRLKMRVTESSGKLAITKYKVLETFGDNSISLVECCLETGRTHQIRVHMAYKKHPIVGDQTYGKGLNFNIKNICEEAKQSIKNFPRQALHAYRLSFTHPINGEELEFESAAPKDINDLITKLK